ncbi:MAG: hypothetical protein FJZ92_01070 [Chloroflexi bacterium]|nr:hypothetical protein [Chloroflexota bacterium]
MNTSKQVNAMIGFLFLAFLVFGAYYAYEPGRASTADEAQHELFANRGAELYVKNCRSCHGLEGLGPEEGAIAPALNTPGFLILGEKNTFGAPRTPDGEVKQVETFLNSTIACGRAGTFMPVWAQNHGGPLQPIQVRYIVSMITQGRWDLVVERGKHHDEETGDTPETIIFKDPSQLSVTRNNCGQYGAAAAAAMRSRDPFAPPGAAPAPAGAPTTPATAGTPIPGALPVEMGEFFVKAPPSPAAGKIAFAVKNAGAIVHNFRLIKSDLAPNALPVAGGVVDEKRVEVVAKIDELTAGQTKSIQADVTAGKYVLICNIAGHYQLGMTVGLTVK